MNEIKLDNNFTQPRLIQQPQQIKDYTTTKKVVAIASTALMGFGIVLALGILAGTTAATLPITLAIAITAALITGLITCLIIKQFFSSSKELKIDNNHIEIKPSQSKINFFYIQYFADQESRIEDIVEALSSHFGKKLESMPASDEELNQILQFIDQIKNALKNFDTILKNVEDQSKLDLYLDDPSIEKKFKVESTLIPLSEQQQRHRRESLQKIINHAYLTRELKQKGKLISGDENEKNLLCALNFNVEIDSRYEDKNLMYEVLCKTVINQLKDESYTGFEFTNPLKLIKESLKLCALKARLNAAGVETHLQIEKFKKTLPLYISLKNELEELVKKVDLKLPENFPLNDNSVSMRFLNKTFYDFKLGYIDLILKNFFGNHKNTLSKFNDENYGDLEFENFLKKSSAKNRSALKRDLLLELCQMAHESSIISERIEHYTNWGKHFKAELIQGFEDAHEILGGGVCLGFSQRISFEVQQNPEITPEQLSEGIMIISRDRFYQGTYATNLKRFSNYNYRSPHFIDNKGFEEKIILKRKFNILKPELNENFKTLEEVLKLSAGWVKLFLELERSRHAILVRWDTERNCYWALDSNEGLVCFENSQINSEDAQKLCLEYLEDLFKLNYSSLKEIEYVQLIKSQPESTLQLVEI